MAKGVSIKFKSYEETVPKLLDLIKFDKEIKKHEKIILKPYLSDESEDNTPIQFVEEVLRYCMNNKSNNAEVFIAEGADGVDTLDLFEEGGYKKLAEKYPIGLVDLNNSEVEEVMNRDLLKFEKIMYPKLLREGFVIALPKLRDHVDFEMIGSLSTMIGAYPASHYSGFFSSRKNKIKKWPAKYSIHDSIICKMPDFGIIDASMQGAIIAGVPLEMDKQAAKLLGKDWKSIGYIRLIEDSALAKAERDKVKEEKKKEESK
ncbi:MAG: DUF362 domain-containing protein [Nanoarchaeota archaeon]|nr:DUF362 domain-containing protein [Nanoarchaeota archaeon]